MHKLTVAAILLGGAGLASAAPAPRLSFGTPIVTGAVDAKAVTKGVTKVVKRSATKLRGCFEKHLGEVVDPHLTVTATFTIRPDGKVTAATAVGVGIDVETCIAGVFGKLRFAKPRGGAPVEVSYPLTYDPAVMMVLGASGGGAFASLTGTADFSSGFGDANIYGSLLGDEIGEMHGAGDSGGAGLGLRGTGPGGGGTGWGTIGTGRYGVIGRGSGTGSGYGIGGGRGGLGGRPAGPTVASGETVAKGELDKAIIRRYIRRNLQKIQLCYEKALLATPKLEGKVTAEFTIGADGLVASSKASGLGDVTVETCIARVIKDIQFAKPRRGAVVVSYPFSLRPAPVAPPAARP